MLTLKSVPRAALVGFQAFVCLSSFKLTYRLVPLSSLLRFATAADFVRRHELEIDRPQVQEIVRVVQAVKRRVPFTINCLVGSLALARVLRLHGIPAEVHLGTLHCSAERFSAHAWVCVGEKCFGQVRGVTPFLRSEDAQALPRPN